MLVTINSGIIRERNFVPVKVEVEVTKGIGVALCGLPDQSVKETLLRTVNALQANGYRVPGEKIIINIAPMSLRKKNTSGLDLPIALGIIYATGQRPLPEDLDKWVICGELGLDGSVRNSAGGIFLAEYCLENGLTAMMPKGNSRELLPMCNKKEYRVLIPETIQEAVEMLGSEGAALREEKDFYKVMESEFYAECEVAEKRIPESDFEKLTDAEQRAVLIAAAGGFDMLAVGDRGRLIAHALREIIPVQGETSVLDTAKNYSALSCPWNGVREVKPLRDVNPYASIAAEWGECAKAHGGVLYVEDSHLLSKSGRDVLSVVRHDHEVTVSRLDAKSVFPADFLTVLACPEDADRKTVRYTTVEYPELPATVEISASSERTLPGKMNARQAMGTVLRVRETQKGRGESLTARLNTRDTLSIYNAVDSECDTLIDRLQAALGLSASRLADLCKIARTIADIEYCAEIRKEHFAEAASFLFFTR